MKCISYLFDGSECLLKGILLSKGVTRSFTGTKFLGKLIDVLLSATKRSANKQMVGRITESLSVTGTLHIHGKYNFGSIKTTFNHCCFSILVSMQLHLLPYQR